MPDSSEYEEWKIEMQVEMRASSDGVPVMLYGRSSANLRSIDVTEVLEETDRVRESVLDLLGGGPIVAVVLDPDLLVTRSVKVFLSPVRRDDKAAPEEIVLTLHPADIVLASLGENGVFVVGPLEQLVERSGGIRSAISGWLERYSIQESDRFLLLIEDDVNRDQSVPMELIGV